VCGLTHVLFQTVSVQHVNQVVVENHFMSRLRLTAWTADLQPIRNLFKDSFIEKMKAVQTSI